MIPLLVLALAIGGAGEPPAPAGPLERFIVCPGNPRCPPRPARGDGATLGAVIGNIAGSLLGRRDDNLAVAGGVSSAPLFGPRLDFASGDASLTPASRERIDALAVQMIANPRLDVLVEGHADSRGTQAANIELAGRRAETAAAYLIERGVAADRITAISWGEVGAETYANDGAAGARYRRVVITLRRGARGTP